MEGPDWINSERFDISATVPEALPTGETFAAAFEMMMQKMLADRFKLMVHREEKIRPAYALVVAKSGIRFKPAPASDCASHSGKTNGTHFVGTCFRSKRSRHFQRSKEGTCLSTFQCSI